MTVQDVTDAGLTFEARVAGEIRAEMARQQVSNRRLAMRMGKTPYWVGDRLKGKTHIEVQDLPAFAGALGVPIEQFVRHQGLEPRTQWLRTSPSQDPLPILIPIRGGSHDDDHDRPGRGRHLRRVA